MERIAAPIAALEQDPLAKVHFKTQDIPSATALRSPKAPGGPVEAGAPDRYYRVFSGDAQYAVEPTETGALVEALTRTSGVQ